jgi:hypothetical protein
VDDFRKYINKIEQLYKNKKEKWLESNKKNRWLL